MFCICLKCFLINFISRWKWVLISPAIILLLSISLFMSIDICFIVLELLYGVHKYFKRVFYPVWYLWSDQVDEALGAPNLGKLDMLCKQGSHLTWSTSYKADRIGENEDNNSHSSGSGYMPGILLVSRAVFFSVLDCLSTQLPTKNSKQLGMKKQCNQFCLYLFYIFKYEINYNILPDFSSFIVTIRLFIYNKDCYIGCFDLTNINLIGGVNFGF